MRSRYAKLSLFSAVLAVLLCIPSTLFGKGVILNGGTPAIGVSSFELETTLYRPVSPIASIILNETWQELFPTGPGTPAASIEVSNPDTVLLKINSNVIWGDTPTRIVTSQDILNSWTNSVTARWDARWALRGIVGIDDAFSGESGIEPLNTRVLQINIRNGFPAEQLEASLASPALRLNLPEPGLTGDGIGPFLREESSTGRIHLTSALGYHFGRAYINSADIIPYTSAENSVLDLGRGNIDCMLITSNEREIWSESSRAEVTRLEPVAEAVVILMINPVRVPVPELRRSLVMAVDLEGLSQVVLGEGSSIAADFNGSEIDSSEVTYDLNAARDLFSSSGVDTNSLVLNVADDPAAMAVGGRLRANWEGLGVPVQITHQEGPPAILQDADAYVFALKLPSGGEGVLPQVLAMIDMAGLWRIIELGLDTDGGSILNAVRRLDLSASLETLGESFIQSSLVVPLSNYEILFAPGPDYMLVPGDLYPGSTLWRMFRSSDWSGFEN